MNIHQINTLKIQTIHTQEKHSSDKKMYTEIPTKIVNNNTKIMNKVQYIFVIKKNVSIIKEISPFEKIENKHLHSSIIPK